MVFVSTFLLLFPFPFSPFFLTGRKAKELFDIFNVTFLCLFVLLQTNYPFVNIVKLFLIVFIINACKTICSSSSSYYYYYYYYYYYHYYRVCPHVCGEGERRLRGLVSHTADDGEEGRAGETWLRI